MATLSAVVVVLAGLAIVDPGRSALAMSISESTIIGNGEVIYGRVLTTSGHPAYHYRVVAYHFTYGRNILDKVVFTDSRGLYRFWLGPVYRHEYIQVNNEPNTVRSHMYFWIAPHHAYRISAKQVYEAFRFFLPIFSY